MIFTRTSSGLSNQHLFHGVDAVVYLEGGAQTFSYKDVCAGRSGTSSPDILYWQAVFKTFASSTRVCFRPVGSKNTLKRLAEDIQSARVSNVFVALDQDLDEFRGSKVIADGVFYTWGYSWENDLFQALVIKESVFAVCPIDRMTNEAQVDSDISRASKRLIDSLRWFVYADLIMLLAGKGLFDRKDGRQYVKATGGQHSEPVLDSRDLRNRIRAINASKTAPISVGVAYPINTKRHCFGHIIGTFLCRVFSWLVAKNSGSPSFSSMNVYALLIQALRLAFANPSLIELQQQHERQFAFLTGRV